MNKIDTETKAIQLSYGDFFLVTFKFFQNMDEFFINDTIIFSIKKSLNLNEQPALVKKIICEETATSVSISLSKEDYLTYGLTPGLYYYDLYMERAEVTLFPPATLTITEVAHNV